MDKDDGGRRGAEARRGRRRLRQWARHPGAPASAPAPAPSGLTEHARRLVSHAVEALRRGDGVRVEATLAELSEPGAPGWGRAVGLTLFGALERRVRTAWERGWQPAECVRMVVRELDRTAGALVADMVAAEHRRYPRSRIAPQWSRQLRELGIGPWWGDDADHPHLFAERHGLDRGATVFLAVRVAAVLEGLPELRRLCPLPGEGAPVRVDGRSDPVKLARIRGLLAKAEATEFPEEAEALTGRAQEMMARHRIDYAALSAAQDGGGEEVVGRRIPVEEPYEAHRAALLNVVARANRCEVLWHQDLGMCTVMGYAHDVQATGALFASLLVQATTAMRLAGPVRDGQGRSATRAFRSAFLAAFADRVGQRLTEAARVGEEEAVRARAGRGRDLAVVVERRSQRVAEAFRSAFPGAERAASAQPSHPLGLNAGRDAADAASLEARESLSR
ncbi:DUF2786 domain-containing protein [Nocardiopsis sp. LOL_012]|uniref:DUF2786 domain-containing protein n=1 Tax=Nocardiopsis sp. LOL_012 TaxID=3345409 RepID=UPI003A8A4760